ncbi:MAG: hypothetical protein ACRBFS_00340 [Aureispira sp.]
MNNPLDNLYSLEKQHNQVAYNALIAYQEIQDPLLWTAQPPSKGSPLRFMVLGVLTMAIVAALILYFEQQFSLWGLVLSLVTCIAIVFIILITTLVWSIRNRNYQQTYYGISKAAIWVKLHHAPLQIYPLDKMGSLESKKGKIYYYNKEDKQQVILHYLPDADDVLKLLLHLQQEL